MSQAVLANRRKLAWQGIPHDPNKQPDTDGIMDWGELIEAGLQSFAFEGFWDASSGTFPISTTSGQTWIASEPGTMNGVQFLKGDRVVSVVDNASTTTLAGNWIRLPAVVDPFVLGVDHGQGTANALIIETLEHVSPDGGQIISFNAHEENDGSPVSVTFNDGDTYTVKNTLGDDISAFGFKPGMVVSGWIVNYDFVLFSSAANNYFVTPLTLTGSGTQNDLVVTSPIDIVGTTYNGFLKLEFDAANTGDMTVVINGAAAVPLRLANGDELEPGTVGHGCLAIGEWTGTEIRLHIAGDRTRFLRAPYDSSVDLMLPAIESDSGGRPPILNAAKTGFDWGPDASDIVNAQANAVSAEEDADRAEAARVALEGQVLFENPIDGYRMTIYEVDDASVFCAGAFEADNGVRHYLMAISHNHGFKGRDRIEIFKSFDGGHTREPVQTFFMSDVFPDALSSDERTARPAATGIDPTNGRWYVFIQMRASNNSTYYKMLASDSQGVNAWTLNDHGDVASGYSTHPYGNIIFRNGKIEVYGYGAHNIRVLTYENGTAVAPETPVKSTVFTSPAGDSWAEPYVFDLGNGFDCMLVRNDRSDQVGNMMIAFRDQSNLTNVWGALQDSQLPMGKNEPYAIVQDGFVYIMTRSIDAYNLDFKINQRLISKISVADLMAANGDLTGMPFIAQGFERSHLTDYPTKILGAQDGEWVFTGETAPWSTTKATRGFATQVSRWKPTILSPHAVKDMAPNRNELVNSAFKDFKRILTATVDATAFHRPIIDGFGVMGGIWEVSRSILPRELQQNLPGKPFYGLRLRQTQGQAPSRIVAHHRNVEDYAGRNISISGTLIVNSVPSFIKVGAQMFHATGNAGKITKEAATRNAGLVQFGASFEYPDLGTATINADTYGEFIVCECAVEGLIDVILISPKVEIGDLITAYRPDDTARLHSVMDGRIKKLHGAANLYVGGASRGGTQNQFVGEIDFPNMRSVTGIAPVASFVGDPTHLEIRTGGGGAIGVTAISVTPSLTGIKYTLTLASNTTEDSAYVEFTGSGAATDYFMLDMGD